MGLLAPLFLLGALAIALPLWLHRLQTQSSDRVPFGSAMLLETTEQQVHVKRELKYRLLLAARIALLLLLAVTFAKPFLEQPPAAIADSAAGTDLVVVDASLSMARTGVFEQARATARQVVDDADDGALIAILVADATTTEPLPPSADKATQSTALTRLEPGSSRVDFGSLMRAVETRAATLPPPVRVHFVSDFQASAMPAQFADVVPAGVAALNAYAVGTGDPVNWAVTAVGQTDSGIAVTVENEGLAERMTDIELSVNGVAAGLRTASGQGSYTVQFDELSYERGDNRIEVRLVTDDDLANDNVGFTVVRNDPPAPVPLITRNPDGLPVTYITAALESVADGRFGVEVQVPGEFDPRILTRYDWAIIDDLGDVDAALESALDAFLARGGNLLAFAGSGTQGQASLPLTNKSLSPADLGSGTTPFRRIATVDLQHPVLAETLGWDRVRVSRSVALNLDGSEDVLVTLDNGAPLLIEERIGPGRLLLVLSAADNQWNDLPVHAVFVGLMIEAAEYLSGQVADIGSYFVGDALSLGDGGTGQVLDPNGESLLSLADTRSVSTIRLEQPGIYTVYTADDESLVAANVDPRESALTAIPQATLTRWQEATFDGRDGDAAALASAAGDAEAGEALNLWPWLLLLVAMLAIAESALGNLEIGNRMRAT